MLDRFGTRATPIRRGGHDPYRPFDPGLGSGMGRRAPIPSLSDAEGSSDPDQ